MQAGQPSAARSAENAMMAPQPDAAGGLRVTSTCEPSRTAAKRLRQAYRRVAPYAAIVQGPPAGLDDLGDLEDREDHQASEDVLSQAGGQSVALQSPAGGWVGRAG